MKAVAFYLPQFHVIPENEAVYGKGFTEWENVRRAKPLFPGHYEPHEPERSLGYYDLTHETSLRIQHQLALEMGVSAFCYYYYNIAGRRLLEKPLDIINRSAVIANEFCLCWDHASWYDNRQRNRRMFLEQEYSEEQATRLGEDLLQYFRNPRYIKIGGRPLFLVFAPERHPLMHEYADILRTVAAKEGLPGLVIAGVEAYAGCPPAMLGLDCMVEFAPNWQRENTLSAPDELPRRMDYVRTVKFMLGKPVPDYLRMRCAFPGWDNTPRRGKWGIACVNNSPELFQTALEALCSYTRAVLPEKFQYVFINAWNEWGEGCHLEPDKKHGARYLQAVAKIMHAFRCPPPRPDRGESPPLTPWQGDI